MPGRKRSSIRLGEELRLARQASGLSQEQLAFDAKRDRTYISHLENGHKSPTLDVLLRICQVLNVAASELVGRVERSLETRKK
jgi:transcriptional regulator with XRE-family HTH domain